MSNAASTWRNGTYRSSTPVPMPQVHLRHRKILLPGAIISTAASSLYALPIRVKNIENNPENVTRFVQISKNPNTTGHEQKCSILIDPELDRAGLLYDLLGCLPRNGSILPVSNRDRPSGGSGHTCSFLITPFLRIQAMHSHTSKK